MSDVPDPNSTTPPPPPQVTTSDCIQEALAKQAAIRPPKAKPRIMPVTPMLPRVPKPKNRRRRKP